jgi:triacylglycerol esterase/lipase EstA (alpha/beta hydrolase family)
MAKKIILIHGLGGTADGTWGRFPEFLEKDLDLDFKIISLGYQSPHILKQFYKRAPSILNIANGLLTDIKTQCDLDRDEIILAGHSLGGVLVKKILLRMNEQKINHKIRKICFFDVPHDGSGFANVGKHISFRNQHLKSLCRDSSELDELNDQWVHSNLDNIFEIMSIVSADDDIVSSSSSKSIFRHHKVETINNVSHITIVKPESTSSPSYIVFKKFALEKNSLIKYRNIASRDLDDWKSIERNHSYNYSIDKKRKSDLEALVDALKLEMAVVRLTGASGLGKTRLLLEALNASESIDDSSVLIFNAPGYETTIKDCIRTIVDDHIHGLVVIENCSTDLHNQLAKEVNKKECLLKIVTIGYSEQQVDDSIHIQLSPLSDDAIKQLLTPILIEMDSSDVDRVARFAQGYPLMATLIAEQYQKEGRLLGSIESSSVVKKLISGDVDITEKEKDMLSACSLFDVFGTAEGAALEEARYIAEMVAGLDMKLFDRVLNVFTKRQIINRAGRYARVVPKPLALTLASEWWDETSYDRQKKLIDTLPDSLIQSFCTQASYLDNQPNVKRFSDRLFGGESPFIQAEELFTEKGSKLFRAFVDVNPKSTSDALYHILSKYSHEQILSIDGNIRRNLVWGLEKLCFHEDFFEKSAWCMLLLASAENEHWSNNATGMFAQLFRVNLSGTQASPNIRFEVLKRALSMENIHLDMIVIEALKQSIDTYGGSRTIGAEYQGTKAPLEEWQPKIWQEIFDFWQQAFDLLMILFERGNVQRERALSYIGHSIRGLVTYGRFDMLDVTIREVVSINGRYWPSALEGIKNVFEYDSDNISLDSIKLLNSWLELLSPDTADLPDKLRILVITPPWEHRDNLDGEYVDVAASNAKALASELSSNIESLFPHIKLLLVGEQRQSNIFGYQLACDLPDIQPLLDLSLQQAKTIEQPNLQFVLGLFRGGFEKSTKLWQRNLDYLVQDEFLINYYPDFICTGKIEKEHLEVLLELIKHGVLPPTRVNILSFGGVTKHIEPNVIVEFCLQLTSLGEQASWAALNVIYMYCFKNNDIIDVLGEKIKLLITAVPLQDRQRNISKDLYHWRDMAEKMLKIRDEDFAISLTNQLILACKYGLNHGDIWSYTKPLMLNIMKDYSEVLWPIISDAIIRAEGIEKYWLKKLLVRETGLAANMPSVLSKIPRKNIIDWCAKNEEIAPVFVASCLNVFDIINDKQEPSELFIALLEKYGNDKRVASELSVNIATRGWSGSLVPYLESDKSALTPLTGHANANVRGWVRDYITYIDQQIKKESDRDEEEGFGFY